MHSKCFTSSWLCSARMTALGRLAFTKRLGKQDTLGFGGFMCLGPGSVVGPAPLTLVAMGDWQMLISLFCTVLKILSLSQSPLQLRYLSDRCLWHLRFRHISVNWGVLIKVSNTAVTENSTAPLVLLAVLIDKSTFSFTMSGPIHWKPRHHYTHTLTHTHIIRKSRANIIRMAGFRLLPLSLGPRSSVVICMTLTFPAIMRLFSMTDIYFKYLSNINKLEERLNWNSCLGRVGGWGQRYYLLFDLGTGFMNINKNAAPRESTVRGKACWQVCVGCCASVSFPLSPSQIGSLWPFFLMTQLH